MRFVLGKALTGLLVTGAVLAIAACGSSSKTTSSSGGAASSSGSSSSSGGKTIDIYSDLPLTGAVTAQTVPALNGEKLALKQAGYKAGQWKVNFISLNDATATSPTNYDLNVCQANARKAATDPKAVYMVGPFNSGCAEVEIPITNQGGLAQVSPANTYPGLTTNDPGTASGEPQKYYPTGKRTYLRIVPRDTIQGQAGLVAMKQEGCTRVAVADDKTPYGVGLATQVQLHGKDNGITVTGVTPLDPTSPNFRSYASTVKASGANCVYTAFDPPGEVELVKDINAAVPTAKIFGGDGVCSGGETNPKMGGFPASIAPLFFCTVATQGLTTYPGGKAFLAAYKSAYGVSSPDPYSIYGYEDMQLALRTIAKLGAQGDSKSAVVAALFATKNYQGTIGTYGFDANGDTTLKSYGLYKVGSDGNPLFFKTITVS
ncbi:MAG TPA: branched-chain amino acid ABC transporter substrate-binding protein [Solirubrobacteraceae bacterium]|nr:branched-chain amino acid ABC transporter substrate-binding protein [Solirubrobacteraceae bacterium]